MALTQVALTKEKKRNKKERIPKTLEDDNCENKKKKITDDDRIGRSTEEDSGKSP